MKTCRCRLVWRLVLPAALGVVLASCAQAPSRYAAPRADEKDEARTPRLTIQTGTGMPLNLPWFIQDGQDWINR